MPKVVMSEELTIPATRELLAGWCGPALFATNTHEVVVLRLVMESDGLCAEVYSLPTGKTFRTALGVLELDISRAECRDRVCRVLAGTRQPPMTAHCGARFRPGIGHRVWCLHGDASPYETFAPSGGGGWVVVDALAALDPNDDTRLPDGSRRVDAQALRAVWMEVCGG